MRLCFHGCSKKLRDGFFLCCPSANVALVAVWISITGFAKGGKLRYELTKCFNLELPVGLQDDNNNNNTYSSKYVEGQ